MNNYSFFKYITGDSKIHLLNSKFKILWMIISIITIILIRDFISLTMAFLFLFILSFKSKVGIIRYFENMLLLWPLYIIIGFVSYIITFNLFFSALLVGKIALILMTLLILTSTTSLSEIAWGFETLFSPLKKIGVPVSKLGLRFAMHIKFISTLFEQSREIRKSMAYRGVPYNSRSILALRKMTIPVISLSYKLSRRMVKIMKLRFYGSSKKRTNYHDNKVTKNDHLLILASFVLLYFVIWLGWC